VKIRRSSSPPPGEDSEEDFGRVRFSEMLHEEFAAESEAFLCEDDGLCFPDGVRDHSFLVQPVHHIPIESFLRAAFVIERQKEQRQRHLIDFVFIVVHEMILRFFTSACNSPFFAIADSISCQPSNHTLQLTASRRTASFHIIKTLQPAATRALARRS
jgi:hypothetical protein